MKQPAPAGRWISPAKSSAYCACWRPKKAPCSRGTNYLKKFGDTTRCRPREQWTITWPHCAPNWKETPRNRGTSSRYTVSAINWLGERGDGERGDSHLWHLRN